MSIKVLNGDCSEVLDQLPEKSVDTCITSPPYYGLRDYEREGQIGLEETPEEYVDKMVEVFRKVRRVLKDEGTVWLNLGDSYASNHYTGARDSDTGWKHGELSQGHQARAGGARGVFKVKDLMGIPWMVAFALREDGWYLRQDIIWHKPNPMPESVTDRCTKAHEYIFLLTKQKKYYYDHEAIKYPVKEDWGTRDRTDGKYHNEGSGLSPHTGLEDSYETANKRSVWTVTTKPFKGAHFAVFPPDLIKPCVLAGCPEDGTVLDPFGGAGTTGLVADRNGRNAILIELNDEYAEMSRDRLYNDAPLFVDVE